MIKRILTVGILLMTITFNLFGCGNNKDQKVPEKSETVNTAQPVEPPPEEIVDTSGFIGENKAKEIALGEAGFGSEGVFFGRVELDNEDGIWQYEVDFRKNKTEYEVVINAEDGSVLSFETEILD